MGVITLGEAARRTGVSKTTLARMLERGAISGVKDSKATRPTWAIDESEVARILAERQRPQRGLRRPVPVAEPPVEARPEAVELAALRAELQGVRDRLADMITRAEAAEAREAAERERVDRLTRLIEDKREDKHSTGARGLLSRWMGK